MVSVRQGTNQVATWKDVPSYHCCILAIKDPCVRVSGKFYYVNTFLFFIIFVLSFCFFFLLFAFSLFCFFLSAFPFFITIFCFFFFPLLRLVSSFFFFAFFLLFLFLCHLLLPLFFRVLFHLPSSSSFSWPHTVDSNTWAQVISLYPTLVECITCSSPEVSSALKEALGPFKDFMQPPASRVQNGESWSASSSPHPFCFSFLFFFLFV